MARRLKDHDEAPEITRELFAKMRPMKDVTPGMAKAIKAARGRPKSESPKRVFSIRLSEPALKRWSSLDKQKRAKLVASFEKKIAETA